MFKGITEVTVLGNRDPDHVLRDCFQLTIHPPSLPHALYCLPNPRHLFPQLTLPWCGLLLCYRYGLPELLRVPNILMNVNMANKHVFLFCWIFSSVT